jgi:CubicO group peptidase (beta-lactamase class C family)
MQRRILQAVMIFMAAAYIISGCTTAPQKPDKLAAGNFDYVKEYISWLAPKEMKKNRVVGLSIAIVDDQQTVWARGFGYADLKNKKPATPETVYRIGSISKLFTVTATMQQAEQGRIDIDQPLQNYLPAFSVKSRFSNTDPITLRSIMTHHSGLPSDVLKGMWAPEPPETLLYRLKDEYVAYPPNYVFAYSNAAMALLGLMIERVSDAEFCEYMTQTIIKPMGMQHSSYKLTPDIESLLSKGYRNGKEAKQLPLRDLAAGSMYSNVVDLSRFVKMVLAEGRAGNQQILRPQTIAEMLRPQNGNVVLDFGQQIGLGWFIDYTPHEKLKIAGHGGGTPLFRTSLMILPQKKIGVVVLTNSTEGSRIHNKIGKEALKLSLEAKTGETIEKKDIRIEPPDQKASEEMLQSFVGRYATLNMLGAVDRKKKTLEAKFEKYEFQLIKSSNGSFGVKRRFLGIFPLKKLGRLEVAKIRVGRTEFNGRELLTVHYDNKYWFSAEKLSLSPLPPAWEKALGKYRILNPDPDSSPEEVRLSKKAGVLELSFKNPLWHSGRGKIYLRPISETAALTTGIGRNSGETMRLVDIDGENGLAFWGYKLKKQPE